MDPKWDAHPRWDGGNNLYMGFWQQLSGLGITTWGIDNMILLGKLSKQLS